jgi:hypothetical protein
LQQIIKSKEGTLIKEFLNLNVIISIEVKSSIFLKKKALALG